MVPNKRQKADKPLWTEDRAKSTIHEFCMKLHMAAQYNIVSEGMDHKRIFKASIDIPVGGQVIHAEGAGKSKKDAQQGAAVEACKKLDQQGLLAHPILPPSVPQAGRTTSGVSI